MRRFEFRAESILRWRSKELDREKTRLSVLLEELKALELEASRIESQARIEQAAILSGTPLTGKCLADYASFQQGVDSALKRLQRESDDRKSRIARQQRILLQAERRVKLLENLKQRRQAEWVREAELETELLAAEAFLSRWAKGRY